jgi:hypothetical protein
VALHVFQPTALLSHPQPVAQLGDQLLHAIAIAGEGGVVRIDVGGENNHVTVSTAG